MRYLGLITIVLTAITTAVVVLAYVGIQFPALIFWGGRMFEPEFLIMLYRLGLLAILVVGIAKLKLAVDWWLKNKENKFQSWLSDKVKELEQFRERYNELLSGHVDDHLKRADRNLKTYREDYENRLDKIEKFLFPK